MRRSITCTCLAAAATVALAGEIPASAAIHPGKPVESPARLTARKSVARTLQSARKDLERTTNAQIKDLRASVKDSYEAMQAAAGGECDIDDVASLHVAVEDGLEEALEISIATLLKRSEHHRTQLVEAGASDKSLAALTQLTERLAQRLERQSERLGEQFERRLQELFPDRPCGEDGDAGDEP